MWNQHVEEPQHQLMVPLKVSLHNTSNKIFASEADTWILLLCAWLEA